jgi:hypothetical protein
MQILVLTLKGICMVELETAVRVTRINLRKFISPILARGCAFWGDDWCGLCAISSFTLTRVLKDLGFKSSLVVGKFDSVDDHCWVEYGGKIIDLTCKQFGGPKILITNEEKWLHMYVEFSRGAAALREIKRNWPREQRPDIWKIRLDKVIGRSISSFREVS